VAFLVLVQADILQMEPPELYVRQNPTPNAYTLAISGRKPFIVVHTSLLELLSPRELQAVLAHGKRQQTFCGGVGL
jgi:Zn-dependent protease with chaperone function